MHLKIFLAGLLSLLAFQSRSQASLELIMENYFKAVGGRDKILQVTASIDTSYNWIKMKKENVYQDGKQVKTLTILKTPVYKKFISFDKRGRPDNEFFYNEKGSTIVGGDVINSNPTRINVNVCLALEILSLFEKGDLLLEGEKIYHNTSYFVVSSKDQSYSKVLLFNPTNFLLDASISKKQPGVITKYSDYRPTNLILQPFLEQSFSDSTMTYQRRTVFYEFNPKIDKRIFTFDKQAYERANIVSVANRGTKLTGNEKSLDEFVSSKFKGKRVMIDLWATWCGPCKKEFRSYDSVYFAFMDKNHVNLVLMSIDKDSDSLKWENSIKKLPFKGYHYRANKEMIQSLQAQVFQGGPIMIPRYVLIDEYGHTVSSDFTRPSATSFEGEVTKHFANKN